MPNYDQHIERLSEDLRTALKGLVRQMRRDTERQEQGLSLIQAMLLHLIHEHPGIGVAELARMQQVRSPTMSGQVKALEAAGLVERAAQEHDRRRSGLHVSPAGHKALRQLRDRRHDWLSQRIARLPPDQMAALAGAIDALNFLADHED
ncbi:MarR family winged helix-turn-helix transcriptional regulator [Massilia orientalis]|jgi:DNA-binding MarR family transcriptional regulator|uniref:MarR family winged helix-turn-helix transcriptional regulator n=1 Tax=Massilia orientalis TaxID=3050128 RepID=A0ACC7MCQ9_9BURK|nr:MarR family transcriptional regulator [Massilia sp. YIM B02787]